MKATRLLLLILLSVLGTSAIAAGQQPAYKPAYTAPSPLGDIDTEPKADPTPPPGVLSDWIVYKRDCCEGRHGICTPLYTEIYRAAPRFPSAHDAEPRIANRLVDHRRAVSSSSTNRSPVPGRRCPRHQHQ